jgi:hypothetical protein
VDIESRRRIHLLFVHNWLLDSNSDYPLRCEMILRSQHCVKLPNPSFAMSKASTINRRHFGTRAPVEQQQQQQQQILVRLCTLGATVPSELFSLVTIHRKTFFLPSSSEAPTIRVRV